MAHDLVAYGILRRRSTLESVLGHPWMGDYHDVLVPGWTKYQKMSGIWYAHPTSDDSILEAVLIHGLTDEDMAKLDRLEGTPTHYRRVMVPYVGERQDGQAWIYCDGSWTPGEKPRRPKTASRSRISRVLSSSSESLEQIADRLGIASTPPVKDGGTSGGQKTRKRRSTTTPTDEATGKPLPLFAYGSLTFREVLEERIGHRWPGQYSPDALIGWRIESGWPRHAVQEMDGVAHGFLLPDLTEEDLAIIDRFEGVHNDVYRRVVVTLESGSEAYFYATGEAGHRRLARRRAGLEPARRSYISGQRTVTA